MSQVFLMGAGIKYDTSRQTVEKGQIIRMEGYDYDKLVVYDIIKQTARYQIIPHWVKSVH